MLDREQTRQHILQNVRTFRTKNRNEAAHVGRESSAGPIQRT
jgi:hypothetical protein